MEAADQHHCQVEVNRLHPILHVVCWSPTTGCCIAADRVAVDPGRCATKTMKADLKTIDTHTRGSRCDVTSQDSDGPLKISMRMSGSSGNSQSPAATRQPGEHIGQDSADQGLSFGVWQPRSTAATTGDVWSHPSTGNARPCRGHGPARRCNRPGRV